MPVFEYDLFVIGAGSGGVRAARVAAKYGARVAIAEEYRVGGTCVIRGCVPKKLLVYASKFSEEFEDAKGFGWEASNVAFSWDRLIANKDREIKRLSEIYEQNLKSAGVDLLLERATILGPNTVQLASGRKITSSYILIATGATPFVPGHIEEREHVITSNEVFELKKLPERVLIVGGGYIAVEFAGIFNSLGSETTLVCRGEQILRGFDDELRNHLASEMKKKGVKMKTNMDVISTKKTAEGVSMELNDGSQTEVNQIVFATGRVPNVEGLGLENAGIELSALGAIPVNEFSQTAVPSIYAVGDVTNRVNLTPAAIREGHAFADTVFGGKRTPVDHRLVPTAVFSQPEIGTVGMTEEEARISFNIDVYKTSFKPMKNALSGRDEKMFMKMIVDADRDRVLGCHISGPEAGEMVQLLGIAIGCGATKAQFDSTLAVHPTAAEELVTMREKSRHLVKIST
jgi:glutathione reductase (NADPH)